MRSAPEAARCGAGECSASAREGYLGAVPLPGRTELTHILVVADAAASRDFYRDVVGAEVVREYGGTSVVLRLSGTWLLLVTGGADPDKPAVTFAVPTDQDKSATRYIPGGQLRAGVPAAA